MTQSHFLIVLYFYIVYSIYCYKLSSTKKLTFFSSFPFLIILPFLPIQISEKLEPCTLPTQRSTRNTWNSHRLRRRQKRRHQLGFQSVHLTNTTLISPTHMFIFMFHPSLKFLGPLAYSNASQMSGTVSFHGGACIGRSVSMKIISDFLFSEFCTYELVLKFSGCLTCWCPCITFGQIAEIVDKGSSCKSFMFLNSLQSK